MNPNDPLANVLTVDLTSKSFRVDRREDLFREGVGGAGVAIRLLAEECPPGCDPLAPENPIVLAVGPMVGMFPMASKTVAMFKSPLTGNLGESHCGGRTAVSIRMAGYGAIVIRGASEIPLTLAVHGPKVFFRDASALWGMRSHFTVGRIVRENEPGSGMRTIMRIGRAGERGVAFACVTSETYRHFGRMGLGALFGSKKLKALIVSGKRSLPVADRKAYRGLYDEIYKAATESPAMKKYHDLGTAENILPLNKQGGLPTRNLQAGVFEGAAAISGEAFAEHHLGRRLACAHCPVGCVHIAALREPYESTPYFYKTSLIGYDYEPIFSLGSMLGIADPKGILKLIDAMESLGLDVMSGGVALAWATEAQDKGLAGEKDLGLKLAFGDWAAYVKAARSIVEQPTDFWRALARGTDHAASVYGGADFAMRFGKVEMPGYHTGPAAHVGFAVGARHSHLDNAGYSLDQKVLAKRKVSPEELGDMILSEERWRQVLSSLVVCFFARGIYGPETVSKALAQAGFALSPEDLARFGERVHREKYAFKAREGFVLDPGVLPKRIFETPSPLGPVDEAYVRAAIEHVRKAMAPARA
ncbi:MAG: aldehyde ferredoxin oxidoreductase family protein [Planctomycetes bacterium]|nr:aldehyde ferredoxin oxidoreductase family protein [Planctomycetota bacterium]